jgi:GT2 family glycosyltransferase
LSQPILSIIIVNFNVEHFLEICLESVFEASKHHNIEVFVVDNHSSDGSLEMVSRRFPSCRVIANKENVGFSTANNQGIRASEGKYVLLLNPDTVLPEDGIEEAIRFMEENPQAGALGFRMVDGSGTFLPESRRGLPTPWVSFCKAFGLARIFPNSPNFGQYYLSYLPQKETHEVDILSGACMFMRREALEKSGLLDESFFMYGEDVDLSFRLQKSGFKNYYFAKATIIHFKGESTKRGSLSFVFHFYRSMLLFSGKHFGSSPAFRSFIFLGVAIRALMALFQRFIHFFGGLILEFVVAYLGMVVIKNWWELNFKGIPGMYPDSFIELLVPCYILVWLISTRLTGRYSESYGHASIIKGLAIGTILISGVTNFFDDYRFSKGLILIGTIWTYLVVTFRFIIGQWLGNRSASMKFPRRRRLLVVGNEATYRQCGELLKSFDNQLVISGWLNPNGSSKSETSCLGGLGELSQLVPTLALDELVFCFGSISRKLSIQLMEENASKGIRYSFLPAANEFIIASTEKHNRGSIYQEETIPNILLPYNLRLKRLTDLIGCILLLFFFPFALFSGAKFGALVSNWWSVFTGKMSWIGLSNNHLRSFGLRDGVITTSNLAGKNADRQVIIAMDRIYSEEFQPIQECWNLLKNLNQIGN